MARHMAPFKWFGGKGNMVAKLLKLLPEHREYVEPYFGAGSVFFNKAPALVETINDLDSAVMGFYRVLRDNYDEFIRLAELSPYSRELYDECNATWRDEPDEVRRAWKWWYVAATSFGGRFGSSLGTVVASSSRGMTETCSLHLSRIAGLQYCHERLQRAQIENTDALTVLERYCTPTSLAYCDPPYVHSTRKAGAYANEMCDADHEALVASLLRLPGRFLLSGYANPVYEPLEAAGWHRVDYQTACNAAGRTRHTGLLGKGSVMAKQPRTESVWLDPATASEVLKPEQKAMELAAT